MLWHPDADQPSLEETHRRLDLNTHTHIFSEQLSSDCSPVFLVAAATEADPLSSFFLCENVVQVNGNCQWEVSRADICSLGSGQLTSVYLHSNPLTLTCLKWSHSTDKSVCVSWLLLISVSFYTCYWHSFAVAFFTICV